MKAFEEWFDKWKKEDPEHRDNFWYFLMKPFMKIAYKAALELILSQSEWGIDEEQMHETIKKELKD